MEEINSWYYVYGVFVGLNIMLAIQYNFFLGMLVTVMFSLLVILYDFKKELDKNDTT